MRETDYDSDHGRPSYEWLADHRFSGLSSALHTYYDSIVRVFFVEEVGLSDDYPRESNHNFGYDWCVPDDETVVPIKRYLSTQRGRGELFESTVKSCCSRGVRPYLRVAAWPSQPDMRSR